MLTAPAIRITSLEELLPPIFPGYEYHPHNSNCPLSLSTPSFNGDSLPTCQGIEGCRAASVPMKTVLEPLVYNPLSRKSLCHHTATSFNIVPVNPGLNAGVENMSDSEPSVGNSDDTTHPGGNGSRPDGRTWMMKCVPIPLLLLLRPGMCLVLRISRTSESTFP